VRAGEFVLLHADSSLFNPKNSSLLAAKSLTNRERIEVLKLPATQVDQHPVLPLSLLLSRAAPDLAIAPYDPSKDKCAELKRMTPSIVACSPNFIRRHFTRSPAINSDDSFMNAQTHLSADYPLGTGVTRAWDLSVGSQSVVVAVLDSGIDYLHPDLSDNMWVNHSEIPGNGIDDDLNGYVDDVHGIDAHSRTGDPFSLDVHGTHVSGIIGARGNNGFGVSGVNWDVALMPIKATDRQGFFSTSDIARGLQYVRMMREEFGVPIKVVNGSFGGFSPSEVEFQSIKDLRDADILFIAAAGNENQNIDQNPIYPASYPLSNIVSVVATDQQGGRAVFSNYGLVNADIGAPGVGVLSTLPQASYGRLDGTSMATPIVTGAIALAISMRPELSASELRAALFDSALLASSLASSTSTGRFLDVFNFLKSVSPSPTIQLQAVSHPLIRDLLIGGGFLGLNGMTKLKFRAGQTLRLLVELKQLIPKGSSATMYVRYRIDRIWCEGPIKISDIQRSSFILKSSSRRMHKIRLLTAHLYDGEGRHLLRHTLKQSLSLETPTASSSATRRICRRLNNSLTIE
jgi:subtilisin family serine protease